MKPGITYGEIEVRLKRAFRWLLHDEEGRWKRFAAIRDRYRPYRLPLQWRLEYALSGMCGGGKYSRESQIGVELFWDVPATLGRT